ncbi:MAG TPA: hypothetical protein VGC14_15530 [Rhizobium sp.]
MTMQSLNEAAERTMNALRLAETHSDVADGEEVQRHVRTRVRHLLHELKITEKRIVATIACGEIRRARLQGGRHGRPRSMTPERIAVATAMIEAGQLGKIVWKTLAAMEGPQIGRSAYYLWLQGRNANLQHE